MFPRLTKNVPRHYVGVSTAVTNGFLRFYRGFPTRQIVIIEVSIRILLGFYKGTVPMVLVGFLWFYLGFYCFRWGS